MKRKIKKIRRKCKICNNDPSYKVFYFENELLKSEMCTCNIHTNIKTSELLRLLKNMPSNNCNDKYNLAV